MKRVAFSLALSLAVAALPARADDFRASAPLPTASHRPLAPTIREAKLPNGVRVLVIERHGGLPVVAVRVVSDVGAFQAGPGVAQLAAESALRGESDLAHSFNEIGALRSVHADWDGVQVSVACLAPALDRAIELAWNTANEASFQATYVKDARDAALREHEDGHWSAMHGLDEALYPAGDPLRDGISASRAASEAIQPVQLEEYFARAFSADHVTLVVVGDTTLEAVVEGARTWLGGARPAAKPAAKVAASPTPAPKRGLTVIDRPGSTESSIAMGAVGVPRTSPDRPAIEVLIAALEHRFDLILRERNGYTYGFHAHATSDRTRGEIVVDGKVETWHTGQSLREMFTVIDQLRAAPVDDLELAVAKALRRALDPRFRETNAAAADALGDLVKEGLPLDTWPRDVVAVDHVTREDVLRVARTYLDPSHMPIVVVGDAKAIVPTLPDVSDTAASAAVPAPPTTTTPVAPTVTTKPTKLTAPTPLKTLEPPAMTPKP